MLTLIIVLALEGLIVGALARLAIPGPDPMSVWMTIALGLAGSFVAGLVVGLVWHRAAGFIASIAGAALLLGLHRHFVQRRPLTRRY